MSSVSHYGVTAVLRAIAALIEDTKADATQAVDPLAGHRMSRVKEAMK